MASNSNADRRQLLGRRNKGRLIIEQYVSQLGDAGLFVLPNAFESIEVSDGILLEFNSISFESVTREKVTPINLKPLYRYIDSILSSSELYEYYLFSEVTKYCGLLKIKRQQINAQMLIDLINIKMHDGRYALMNLEMRTWFDSDEEVIDGRYQQCYTVECHSHKKSV